MNVKIKDMNGFEASVFGADCILEHWPEIKTTGIEVQLLNRWGNEYYYVMKDGEPVNCTAFFSHEEMVYLEEVVDNSEAH